jgi:hypothetical protein
MAMDEKSMDGGAGDVTQDVNSSRDGDVRGVGRLQDIVAEGELGSEQILERTILYALEQAVEMLGQSGTLEPFTILIEGEELYLEDHPGENEEQSYASARRTVYQMERLCNAYVFCYDGYVDLEDGRSDALIVEYANKGDEAAQVIIRMYHAHGDHYHFDEELYQVGEATTLFNNEAPHDTTASSRNTAAPTPQDAAPPAVSAAPPAASAASTSHGTASTPQDIANAPSPTAVAPDAACDSKA